MLTEPMGPMGGMGGPWAPRRGKGWWPQGESRKRTAAAMKRFNPMWRRPPLAWRLRRNRFWRRLLRAAQDEMERARVEAAAVERARVQAARAANAVEHDSDSE